MKIQAIIASIVTLAMAAPASHVSSPMELQGVQIRSLLDVLKSHGTNINLDIEQLITCNVSYTLSLSTTGPPYTIELSTLDLTNCAYSV